MNTKYETLYEGAMTNFARSALAATLIGTAAPSSTNAAMNTPPSITANVDANSYSKEQMQNIIARTLWREARSDGENGMRAVASVIYNRGKGNITKMVNAIKAPKQFSCWNKMTASDWANFKIKQYEGPSWTVASKIATEMVNGALKPTTDATHYYNDKKVSPDWATQKQNRIGSHVFSKEGAYRAK